MNQVFVYVQNDGKKMFIGMFDLENIEEDVREKLLSRSLISPGYRCYFIYGNDTFELNV